MTSFQKLSVRSSETLRQWFRKLQCFLPVSFTRTNANPESAKLITYEGGIDDDMFPSQKNLDEIMDTLRKDLVDVMGKSGNNKSITVILYKLNTLDNNIREACRFQNNWISHPMLGRESLKVQEKYIVRLIEEIMDDIFEAYSSLKRRTNDSSFNERSINGVISVLGILKREVCNMINVIISSIEAQHKNSLYAPKPVIGQYRYPFDNKNAESLSHAHLSALNQNNYDKSLQSTVSNKSVSLANSKSYPMFTRKKGILFSSLENMCYQATENPLQDNIYNKFENHNKSHFKDISADSRLHFKERRTYMTNSGSALNIEDMTNGSGDAEKYANTPNNAHQPLSHRDYEVPRKIPPTIETYFAYEEKKDTNSLLYNKAKDIIQNENMLRTKTYFKPKNSTVNKIIIKGNIAVPLREKQELRTQIFEKESKLSWPSGTVIRDIKSDNYLDNISKAEKSYNPSQANESSKLYESSDSDSDESYISCVLDEYELGAEFLNHVKEQFIHKPFEILTHKNHTMRDKTDNFSCKSAKMSENFTGKQSLKRNSNVKPEMYHSIESIPCLNFYIYEEVDSDQKRLSKGVTCLDASISTDPSKMESSKEFKVEGANANKISFDSFKTLALSDEGNSKIDDVKSIYSVESFKSVNSNKTNAAAENSSSNRIHYSTLYYQQLKPVNQKDFSPNLEDSQFSTICLTSRKSNSKLWSRYIGDENKLLAMEM